MQNLVVFIEPSEDASNISSKAAKLYLNRFCIDEEAACEVSGVYYLKSEEPLRITLKRKAEGKAHSDVFQGVKCVFRLFTPWGKNFSNFENVKKPSF